MTRARPVLLLAAVLAALAVLAAGCSGDDDDRSGAGTTTATSPGMGATTETETETETEAGGSADATAGKALFASNGCASCHTLADAGATGTVGPNLDESSVDEEAARARIRDGGGAMPAFGDQLSEDEIASLAAYVVQARG